MSCLEKIKKWHEELKELCNWYLENDRYIYMGLIQRFEVLDDIIQSLEETAND